MKRSLDNLENESILVLKVKTENGYCFFNEKLEFLVGPIKNPQIEYIDNKSCYIFEYDGKKNIGIFYIVEENGVSRFKNKLIEKEYGINVYVKKYQLTNKIRKIFSLCCYENDEYNLYWFEIKYGKISYIYSSQLDCISKKAHKVVSFEGQKTKYHPLGDFNVLVFNENDIPEMLYTQRYLRNNNSLTKNETITEFVYICKGIGDDKVVVKAKDKNELYFFGEDGIINFSTFGSNCLVDNARESFDSSNNVYIVRNYEDKLEIYSNKHKRIF